MIDIFIQFGTLIVGFIFLVKGADYLVDGGSSLAKRFGISELVIGLTVVSFGTSAPELVVNLISAGSGSTDLALGNIIGSNIANILLVLGVAGSIYPLTIKNSTVWREIPLALLAAFALFFLANDSFIDGDSASLVSRSDGLVLLLIFSVFLYYTYLTGKVQGGEDNPDIRRRKPLVSVGLVVAGVAGLVLGGSWIVNGASSLARGLGISEVVIGLTVVAVGTSLPELATSAVAAWRRNTDIAIGNVIGSNVFNILFVLAVTSVFAPLPAVANINTDLLVMLGATILLFVSMFIGFFRHKLERWQAYMFLALYVIYIGHLAFRG